MRAALESLQRRRPEWPAATAWPAACEGYQNSTNAVGDSNDLWTLTEGEVFAPHSILHMLSRYRAVPCSYPSQHHWVEESWRQDSRNMSQDQDCDAVVFWWCWHEHLVTGIEHWIVGDHVWLDVPSHTRSTPMGKSQGLSVTRCCAHAFKSKLSHKRHKHSHRTSINVVYPDVQN